MSEGGRPLPVLDATSAAGAEIVGVTGGAGPTPQLGANR